MLSHYFVYLRTISNKFSFLKKPYRLIRSKLNINENLILFYMNVVFLYMQRPMEPFLYVFSACVPKIEKCVPRAC